MNMADFDDVVFEEDEFEEKDTNSSIETQEEDLDSFTQPTEETSDDITAEVLKMYGIPDMNKIKFEDESGAVIERSWDSLSRDEQINILTQKDQIENTLDDAEITLLNNIRSSGLSVQDYLNNLQNNNVKPEPPTYKIDALSDEEIYALDLLEKVGSDNISDEELTAAIESAKSNKDLFDKTVSGLRKEYIRMQQDEEAEKANQIAAEQQQAYNNFATSILSEIKGLNSFAGKDLELSQQDSEDLASFMLDLDDSGMSAFGKALQNPKLFTKAAFWLLNEDAIVEELTKQMQDTYKRGYATGKQDLEKVSPVVFKKSQSTQNNEYLDDSDWI